MLDLQHRESWAQNVRQYCSMEVWALRDEVGGNLASRGPVFQSPLSVKTTLTPTNDTDVLVRDTGLVSLSSSEFKERVKNYQLM